MGIEAAILDNTLRVINSLEADGIIGRYAIGGAIGLVFYTEPETTYDLDIFCLLPMQGLLIDLGPVYKCLVNDRGCEAKDEHIIIEGIPVQFLPPNTKLMEEALEKCVDTQIEGVPTRVLSYEHLLAIMVETGRNKDKLRINIALDSKKPNMQILQDILKRHGLLDKWGKITA